VGIRAPVVIQYSAQSLGELAAIAETLLGHRG